MSKFIESLQTIYSSNELKRLICFEKDGQKVVKVDVHGMTCHLAQQYINNIINLSDSPMRLVVIHGFHHGTAISKMVRTTFKNERINQVGSAATNPGITYLDIA